MAFTFATVLVALFALSIGDASSDDNDQKRVAPALGGIGIDKLLPNLDLPDLQLHDLLKFINQVIEQIQKLIRQVCPKLGHGGYKAGAGWSGGSGYAPSGNYASGDYVLPGNYVPPNGYEPQGGDYVPQGGDYVPQGGDYVPQGGDYVPPVGEYEQSRTYRDYAGAGGYPGGYPGGYYGGYSAGAGYKGNADLTNLLCDALNTLYSLLEQIQKALSGLVLKSGGKYVGKAGSYENKVVY
ncbi:hypothetical protein BgiMline_016717 [Biomphalaria glabrata]|nr:hypothetical protein BgiMline_009515 [Biomphalaria glabrata]